MRPILRHVRGYAADALLAWRVAPLEVLLAVVVALGFSLMIDATPGTGVVGIWQELAVACGIAASVAWTATLLHGLGTVDARGRWLLSLAGVAASGLYAATLLDLEREAEAWRSALLLSAAALLPLLAAVLARNRGGSAEDRFREVGLRIATRAGGVSLYSALLFVGLAGAIAAVDSLFELNLDADLYAHVWGWTALGLGPWLLVGGTPSLTAPPAPPSEAARVTRRFAAYLILPLLVLYYGIIYAYAARIAVLGELPSNLVSPLVLVAGGLAALAVVHSGRPAPDDDAAPPLPTRLAAPLFLPLGALAGWAILLRVQQYGWTEFRYVRLALLLVLAGLAVAATVTVLRKRPLLAWPVPAALAGVALISAVGPWSVVAVSLESQAQRLGELVGEAPPRTESPREPVEVSPEVYDEVNALGSYLAGHHGEGAIRRVVGEVRWSAGYPPLAELLGFRTMQPELERPRVARLREPLDLASLAPGLLYPMALGERPQPGLATAEPGADGTVRVRVANRVLTGDLSPLSRWLRSQPGGLEESRHPGAPMRPAEADAVALPPELARVGLTGTDGGPGGTLLVQLVVLAADEGKRPDPRAAPAPGGVRPPVVRLEGFVVLRPD